MPSGPTWEPANIISVIKILDFLAESDKRVLWTRLKKSQVHPIMLLKSSPTMPPLSTSSSISSLTRRSPSFMVVMCANVDRAPVRPNGMCFWVKKAMAFYIVFQIRTACLWYCDCIESRGKIEPMNPPVATESALFHADISLGHWKYVCDFI